MLKSINTSETFANLVEKRCAEVYFRKENCFTITCTLCELKTFDFDEYSLHFKNVHLITWESPKNDCNIKTVEDEIKVESDNTHAYEEFGPLTETQQIPLTDLCNFSSNRGDRYLVKDDILNDCNEDNEWTIEDDLDENSEEQSNQNAESMPRVFKVEPSNKSTSSVEYTCPECNRSYKFAKNLERHIKKSHTETSEYNCVRCKQNFSDERSLYAHQRKKHAGYPCEQCDKVYSSKEALNIHRYRHTGVRSFHCNVEGCGKSFFNPKNLAMHTRIVHRLEKNFVCETCGFRTKGRPALIVHKRSHTGEKPFICKLCGKGFASKSLLCEHEPSHSKERPHVCNVCGRSFSRPKALYHHKYLHLGIKKFVCQLCGRAYAQMAGLAGHMRQHKAEK